jgi:uncharacterized membrane protein YoaT (DUF817 family)
MLIIYAADSGAAETYTGEKYKMAVSPQQKSMFMLWYWETISVIQDVWEYVENKSSWERVHQAMVGSISRDKYCPV